MTYQINTVELSPEMLSKVKLDRIHILLSVLMLLVFGFEIYYISELFNNVYIDTKEKVAIVFILVPILYFIFLFRIYRLLKKDIHNNRVKIYSGIVTGKKISSTGSGKSIAYKFELYFEDNMILVDKYFYNKVVIGNFIQWGILPLSEVVVYKNIQ